jgi:hypothetical protein
MRFLRRQLEDAAGRRRLARWFYALLAVSAAAEIVLPNLFDTEAVHFWFESIPAWGSLYGLVSCVAIIVVSKALGKVWLSRPESHYDS